MTNYVLITSDNMNESNLGLIYNSNVDYSLTSVTA